jgi:hypothetical protein
MQNTFDDKRKTSLRDETTSKNQKIMCPKI